MRTTTLGVDAAVVSTVEALRKQAITALDAWVAEMRRAGVGAMAGGDLPAWSRELVAWWMSLVFACCAEARGMLAADERGESLAALCIEARRGFDPRVAAYPRVAAVLQRLNARGATLFTADDARWRGDGVGNAAVAEMLTRLAECDGAAVAFGELSVEEFGGLYEGLVEYELRPSAGGEVRFASGLERRRTGSHYTPRALTEPIVAAVLAPLVSRSEQETRPEAILALRVCDPAMGTGAFLVEACRQLGQMLYVAWGRRGGTDDRSMRAARAAVAKRCLYGVDKNELAVRLARLAVWLEVGAADERLDFVDDGLRCGDALLGRPYGHAPGGQRALALGDGLAGFDWDREFREVFAREGRSGFDAMVGNPPWVSYAGRAAQPLDDAIRRTYRERYRSFARYGNLQGIFVERAAQLLAPGGRLGLVLPSSMAELAGYAPTRAAHDALAVCDDELPDLGEDSFRGVFQPSMVLLSTRRAVAREHVRAAPWPIARADLDDEARAILARLAGPTLPSALFGERGLQSFGEDTAHMHRMADGARTVPMRVGGDIMPFARSDASLHAEVDWFGGRLRAPNEWLAVAVLIRQTARVPIAVLSDGAAFRNSILAGFGSETYPADFLVAYLNSTPIRWWHYASHRDARLGMPQVKIGHLRAIPAPRGEGARMIWMIAQMGAGWSQRNIGISHDEQRQLDAWVCGALGLEDADMARIWRDAAEYGKRWGKTLA